MHVRVEIVRLDRDLPLPEPQHPGDAGLDLRSAEDVTIPPGERAVVRTGIAIAIPDGYAGFVVPRSGLAARLGLGKVNSPGVVDAGYRGEVRVICVNLDPREPIKLARGERMAQLLVVPVAAVDLVEVEDLPPSERGEAGLGSTGVH